MLWFIDHLITGGAPACLFHVSSRYFGPLPPQEDDPGPRCGPRRAAAAAGALLELPGLSGDRLPHGAGGDGGPMFVGL